MSINYYNTQYEKWKQWQRPRSLVIKTKRVTKSASAWYLINSKCILNSRCCSCIQAPLDACLPGESFQLCLTLCNPMDYSLPGSSVQETLQARILEWVAMFCSRGSSRPREQTPISYTAGRFFTTEPPGSLYLLISHLNSITPLLTVGNT